MGSTPGDALPWPPGYDGVPADVPNDLQKLAEATQTALNKRMTSALTQAAIGLPGAGWKADTGAYNAPLVQKTGALVVARGLLLRTTNLSVTDNGSIDVGDIPAGYRPGRPIRAAVAWSAKNSSTGNKQLMTTQLVIAETGVLTLISNVTGVMEVNDGLYFGGLAWSTA